MLVKLQGKTEHGSYYSSPQITNFRRFYTHIHLYIVLYEQLAGSRALNSTMTQK